MVGDGMHDGMPFHRLPKHAGQKSVRDARRAVGRGARWERPNDHLSRPAQRISDARGDRFGGRWNGPLEQIHGIRFFRHGSGRRNRYLARLRDSGHQSLGRSGERDLWWRQVGIRGPRRVHIQTFGLRFRIESLDSQVNRFIGRRLAGCRQRCIRVCPQAVRFRATAQQSRQRVNELRTPAFVQLLDTAGGEFG